MFSLVKPNEPWSNVGLRVLVFSIIAAVALALADGVMKGPVENSLIMAGRDPKSASVFVMLSTWVVDFRYLAEQAVYAATVFFVGAKFIETRTTFTVGFDKADSTKISFKGPDENNVVWIGHRYANLLEAEAVAEAFAERLKESAT